MDTPGTFGTVNPSLEYTLGLQQDVRSLALLKVCLQYTLITMSNIQRLIIIQYQVQHQLS